MSWSVCCLQRFVFFVVTWFDKGIVETDPVFLFHSCFIFCYQARSVLQTESNGDLEILFKRSIEAELLRCQSILRPLLKLDRSSRLASDVDSKHHALLALGAMSTSNKVTTELQSSLALVAPSQRFNLLSIATTFR